MRDIFLDVETMGIERITSAVVAIGAVEFDMGLGTIGRTFQVAVHLGDAVNNHGLTMEASTVLWWLGQGKDAQGPITSRLEALPAALDQFTAFARLCCPIDDLKVWGKGPSTDNAFVRHCYACARKPMPWHYWFDRDFRTMDAFCPLPKDEMTGVKHNAVDDAMRDVKHLMKIRQHMMGVFARAAR